MKKYNLTVFDAIKDNFIEMSFKAESDKKAIEFAKEVYRLKTMNSDPVRITSLWLLKWSWRKFRNIRVVFHDDGIHGVWK